MEADESEFDFSDTPEEIWEEGSLGTVPGVDPGLTLDNRCDKSKYMYYYLKPFLGRQGSPRTVPRVETGGPWSGGKPQNRPQGGLDPNRPQGGEREA